MAYKDYYKVLGVTKNADAKTIKQAFRKLARQYHPDTHPNDPQAEERFKEINEAYEVLGDADKRSKYDQYGSAWQQVGTHPTDAGGFPGGNYGYTTTNVEDLFGGSGGFSDFFETLFGRQHTASTGGGTRARKGQDVEHPLTISLHEAYHGGTRRLNRDGQSLDVKIPRGVKTGSKIRLSGEGNPGIGGAEAGDLFLVVQVSDDPRFTRNGDDLLAEVEVPLYTAILGGKIDVPTMDGSVKLAIPAETQNGRKFRLGKKGMPKVKGQNEFGDLYVTVRVKLPQNLTKEEREHFEQLAELRG